jgi:hypothetical protein
MTGDFSLINGLAHRVGNGFGASRSSLSPLSGILNDAIALHSMAENDPNADSSPTSNDHLLIGKTTRVSTNCPASHPVASFLLVIKRSFTTTSTTR